MSINDVEKKKITTSSGGGYKPLHDVELSKPQVREETVRERAERQRRERRAELTYTAEDYARWDRNRERVLAERKTEIPKFDLDEVLANPELDAIKPVNIDPASMLADDIESLTKEGKEFINNPTLAGAASMAVMAIPGKYADKVFEKSNFFKKYEFDAPSGIKQKVYQQEIDWDLGVNTRNGIKTNLELASEGRSPFVIKDGKYSQINLHHSKQNSKGSLFELSAKTHQKYYGTNSLHPYLPNKHPTNPVDRDSFDLDREAYWIERAENEIKKR
ncbi:hypothetical protein KUL98_004910 [Vibrio parahaemolyticus]|nr:hypothetical protein [Vibrio parahaemolyticus]